MAPAGVMVKPMPLRRASVTISSSISLCRFRIA